MNTEPSFPSRTWVAAAAIFAVAVSLRFAALDSVPPGLWFDEALNAQDAIETAGELGPRLLYPEVFPREPLFVWLLSIPARFAPTSVAAYRAMAALVSLGAVVALYFCVGLYASRRVALLSAAALAGMRWHVLLGRLLFRTNLMPLWAALIVAAAAMVSRKPRSWVRVVFLGALIGGGFYTYLSWYFILPGVAAITVWALRSARDDRAVRLRALVCFVVALAVFAPLGVHYLTHSEDLLNRPREISPFSEGAGPAAREIGENFIQALGMFHYAGDHVVRQNVPGAAALDPVSGVFFLIGLAVAARGASKRKALETIALAWLVLGVLPAIFAKTDSPNFLRSLVAAPAAAILIGMGLNAVWEFRAPKWAPKAEHRVGVVFFALVIALFTSMTARDIFGRWGRSSETWQGFNGPQTQLAKAAAAAPAGGEFWVPELLAAHRTFELLAGGPAEIVPYRDFGFLRSGARPPKTRRVVTTAHNRLHETIDRVAPGAEVIHEFRRPDKGVWALVYEIEPGDLPEPAEVDRAEALHGVDIRW